jgi:hypothetical protein
MAKHFRETNDLAHVTDKERAVLVIVQRLTGTYPDAAEAYKTGLHKLTLNELWNLQMTIEKSDKVNCRRGIQE